MNLDIKENKMNGLFEKNTEEILLKTTTLLASCVEKLGEESSPARSAYIIEKIATCLEILKSFTMNGSQNCIVDISDS